MGNENCQDANQACKIAKQLLTSGKPPPKAIGKNTGEYWNDVHQYCRDANVAKDGLLVVKSKPDILSGNIPRERIVIPKPLVPALLYHLHNHDDGHPAKTQQKQRQFYAIHPTTKKTISFRNGSLLFNLQYLGQIFIKSNNQGQFRNPQDELISKLVLVVRFDQELLEIFRVKEKASISKWYHFYWTRVYFNTMKT